MRKTLILVAFCAFIFSCNSGGEKPADTKAADTTAATTTTAETGKYDKALEIIGSLDCLTCHKINEKSTGPAYTDVAQKYPATDATVDTLANKIIHGGAGNWGQVPMTAHPNLSLDSAREVVRYILSLKK